MIKPEFNNDNKDISYRKAASANNQGSAGNCDENYHALFEQATDPILVTDFNGNFKDVNSSFCTLFGYAKDELLQMNIKQLLDEEHLKKIPIRFDLLAAGENIFNERKMVNKEGVIVYVEANAKKISDNHLLVIARDITARKKVEQELLDQKIQEQRKISKAFVNAQEKEREEIGAELHDNVNPLLAASALYLKHSLTQPDRTIFITKGHEYVTAAMEEIRKLSHALVGPTDQKTMGLIDSIVKLINNIILVKDIKISFDYSTYREEENEAGLKLVIYRIIQEQLNNIIKHANAFEVEIELRKDGDELEVSINDNGNGFDIAAKRNGIGLSNIKNRAAIYDGVVQITSSPGNGCKMKIVFKPL